MKKIIIILSILTTFFLPMSATAQEEHIPTKRTEAIKTGTSASVKPVLGDSNLPKQSNVSPKDEAIDFNNSDGLYHIVITTQGKKRESIWVELDHGEQKYITIKLDNGSKKDVSIQLNDTRQTVTMMTSPYNKLSKLTLQPISF